MFIRRNGPFDDMALDDMVLDEVSCSRWERADLLAVVFELLCFVSLPDVFWSTSELRVRLAP